MSWISLLCLPTAETDPQDCHTVQVELCLVDRKDGQASFEDPHGDLEREFEAHVEQLITRTSRWQIDIRIPKDAGKFF